MGQKDGRGWTIRRSEPQDAAEVARLIQELSRHEGDPTEHFTEAVALRDVCAPDAPLSNLVAEGQGGRLLGLVLWHFGYESAYAARGGHVTDLVVTEEARGQGIGEALLAGAARAIRHGGGGYLWLTATLANERAHAFYRRHCDVENRTLVAFALTGDTFNRFSA